MQGGTRCWPNPEADQADSQTEVTTRVITAIVTGVVLNYLMAEIVLPRVDASYLAQALYGAVGLDAGLDIFVVALAVPVPVPVLALVAVVWSGTVFGSF